MNLVVTNVFAKVTIRELTVQSVKLDITSIRTLERHNILVTWTRETAAFRSRTTRFGKSVATVHWAKSGRFVINVRILQQILTVQSTTPYYAKHRTPLTNQRQMAVGSVQSAAPNIWAICATSVTDNIDLMKIIHNVYQM